MSGHSHWAGIKHKKALKDAQKANVFTKLAKDIAVAARGGGDPAMNFSLKLAIDRAKASNMPKDNIERAIKRGTGELKDGAVIEEIVYEGYGPGQIAMLIKTATDNKNRTLGEVRSLMQKNGGKMVEGGSVSWQFEQVGSLLIGAGEKDEEQVEMDILESGAKDFREAEGDYFIFTVAQDLQKAKDYFEENGYEIKDAGLIFLAKDPIEIDENTRISYEKLLEALDEHDDVVEIFDNIA